MRHSRTAARAAFLLLPALAACSNRSGAPSTAPAPACTFVNPVAPGADPWVVRRNGWYYLSESRDDGIYVYRSDRLTAPKQNGVKVWSAPDTGWNHSNVWAPELHFIDGRWYIYYAASRTEGAPFVNQRSGVLQSVGDDPQGAYVDKGMLYTGTHAGADTTFYWAIDLTVGQVNGQLYAVWSGWAENASTDKTPQQLYIATMSNPWTISSDRVLLTAPTESWERGTELDLQEGPEFLQHGDQTFIIYSTRESWLPDYRLGQLRLNSPTADPMSPASFTKTGPVFAAAPGVYGVGHSSFTVSPDSSESWIVYHSKVDMQPGWNRVIRAQKFTWNADGSPNFGTPVPSGQRLPVPSGQCVA
jgi:GH43 family beta-xylosidase